MKKSKFSKQDIQSGVDNVFREFFTAVVAVLSFDKRQKELSYVKTMVTLPDGGTYLISILHVQGPKLDLQLLKKVTDSQKVDDGTNPA